MDDTEDLGVLFSGQFFGPDECARLCEEMRTAPRYPATVYKKSDYAVRPEVRNTSRVRVAPSWADLVQRRLGELKPRLEGHFGRPFGGSDERQFLAYSEGQFFRPHRDIGDAVENQVAMQRNLSVVVLLNPGEYEGGRLVLHDMGVPGSRMEIKGRPGGFVAFHPVVLHEVTPVARGERYSIAAWFERPGGAVT